VQGTLILWFLGVPVLIMCVDLLLNGSKNNLIFLLKEPVILELACSLAKSVFEICV
jgi:hypothetical protein